MSWLHWKKFLKKSVQLLRDNVISDLRYRKTNISIVPALWLNYFESWMGFQTLFVDFTVCNLKNSIACSSAAGKIWSGGMGDEVIKYINDEYPSPQCTDFPIFQYRLSHHSPIWYCYSSLIIDTQSSKCSSMSEYYKEFFDQPALSPSIRNNLRFAFKKWRILWD